ncbi:MAG TPA: hypothetical protein VGF16_11650 [Bryobacteraceae bacterium]|jgi:hypothetical protein
MKVTRRELGSALAAGVAAAQTQAQPTANPDAELQRAREQVKANSARLAAEPVPMSTEPAFQFKP